MPTRSNTATRLATVALLTVVVAGGCAAPVNNPLEDVNLRMEQLQALQPAQVNDLTTQCMIAQGYNEYVMRPPQVWEQPPLLGVDGEPLEFGTLEFAETHGFGIVSNMLYIYENDVPPELREVVEPGPEDEDPELLFALWSEVQVDGLTYAGGCYGWANQTWEQRNPEWAAIEPFGEELSRYLDEADIDPRVVAIEDAFVTCMRGQGFSEIERKSDLQASVTAMVEAAVEQGTTQEQQIASLERIREYEIELAIATWRCTQEVYTAQNIRMYEQVRAQYEAQFVADHPELLEPFE
ncbi:hypothetical protein BMS3Bbin02_00750 [bacterium BMS3Bbin02]|nr:hypothetical protein BMS3Bbin02_00750 [bacterium BMS3Bbin02]